MAIDVFRGFASQMVVMGIDGSGRIWGRISEIRNIIRRRKIICREFGKL
jgi:hypothetical protein